MPGWVSEKRLFQRPVFADLLACRYPSTPAAILRRSAMVRTINEGLRIPLPTRAFQSTPWASMHHLRMRDEAPPPAMPTVERASPRVSPRANFDRRHSNLLIASYPTNQAPYRPYQRSPFRRRIVSSCSMSAKSCGLPACRFNTMRSSIDAIRTVVLFKATTSERANSSTKGTSGFNNIYHPHRISLIDK